MSLLLMKFVKFVLSSDRGRGAGPAYRLVTDASGIIGLVDKRELDGEITSRLSHNTRFVALFLGLSFCYVTL